MARRRSSCPPPSPNLVRTHPVAHYQALRDSAPCLLHAATLPKGTKLQLGRGAHLGTPSSANHTAAASHPTGQIAKAASWLHLSKVSPALHRPERPSHTHSPKPDFRGREKALGSFITDTAKFLLQSSESLRNICTSYLYICINVYVCIVITYSKRRINRVRLSILLVVSWEGEMKLYLSPFALKNLVSRDGFGIPVQRQPARLHTQAGSCAYLRDSSRFRGGRRPSIYLNHHTPSGQPRVYRVAHLRTDGVHCREPAGTGPINLKMVPNGCCLGRSPWTN